ncbi:MAG: beta-lactamase family protein [Chitinophagales bacterium]|nr:beta-lactamase family protein [Chitinophagaceae bacterium]MCB9064559.1 beta-lactamase family protein [Chitinophagales bacterium]
MKTLIYSLCFLLPTTLSAQSYVKDVLKKYEDSVKDYGIVALVSEGDLVSTAAIGEADNGTPMTDEHKFCIGSITKTYTATTIFRLQDMGKLNINDSIGKYITLDNEYISPNITIRQLMNHSSGIKDFGTVELLNTVLSRPDKYYTPDYCIGLIDTFDFLPGAKHEYSNSNYLLLALIIEQVAQQPLPFVYQDLLFKPWGLDNTYPYYSKAIPGMAHPMFRGKDLFDVAYMKPVNDISIGDGNIVTTASELHRFFTRLVRGKVVLMEKSYKQMTAFEKGEKTAEYGCGIFRKEVGGKELIYHTGRQASYVATAVYVPAEDKTVIVLTNNMDDTFADLVVNELLGVKFY